MRNFNYDPSRMTVTEMNDIFKAGKFSLRAFLNEYRDEIPEENLQLLEDEAVFKKAEEFIGGKTETYMTSWLWGDKETLGAHSINLLGTYDEESFKIEAKEAEEYVMSFLVGEKADFLIYEKETEVFDEEHDDEYETVLKVFFDELLYAMNSNQLEYEFDYELYNDFMAFIANKIAEMAPGRGFEVFYQLAVGEGKVSIADFKKIDDSDWYDVLFEFNTVVELMRFKITEAAEENLHDKIADLDKTVIKRTLREFAVDYTTVEWESCAPAVAAIAYASL